MSTPKKLPKIAIITRTMNRPLLLARALKSVNDQTYHDYVHVIFNDGGDRSLLEELLKKFPNDRRIVINSKANVSYTKALNQAIRAVDSEYVTILDDDDSWPSERLEKTVSELDRTGGAAVVVKMDTVIEEIQGDRIRKISQHLHPESGEGEISLFKQCHKNYISNGIVTYRRSVYDELGGYDESLEVGEDWDFGIRLMLKHDVSFLRNEPVLFYYHQRPSQKGNDGNSVHANVYQQEKSINVIRNRYLRQDINAGRFGVGYIMNQLEQDMVTTVRLERHINHCTDEVNQNISKTSKRIWGSSIPRRAIRKLKRNS